MVITSRHHSLFCRGLRFSFGNGPAKTCVTRSSRNLVSSTAYECNDIFLNGLVIGMGVLSETRPGLSYTLS